MEKQRLTAPASRRWTQADDYVEALVRRRTLRRRRSPHRTEPEAPRLLLSTIPFLALLAALAVLSVAIMVAAWPGRDRPPATAAKVKPERGVAPRGWFQEAAKQFH